MNSKDCFGRERGACNECLSCDEYIVPEGGGVRCARCNCTPVQHENLSLQQKLTHQDRAQDDHDHQMEIVNPASQCQYPGCSETVDFDMNTGLEFDFCSTHSTSDWCVEGCTISSQYDTQSVPSQANSSNTKLCAIPECGQPCYVDSNTGIVHDCCGYTHAMEYQRRLNLQHQGSSNIIKGITHCLLPNCDNLVWPFRNYCGKTHATKGNQLGLIPPQPQASDPSKATSTCIIPNCTQPKYVESGGKTHPYCGKSHAALAKQLGIFPTADKPEDQCEMEGCNRPKLQEGTRLYDYCSKSHADQDAPNRAARILTKKEDVEKWLTQFSSLKSRIVRIEENDAAKPPNGLLYKRFQAKVLSLPANQRKTCLAFHGSSAHNVTSICQNGYDPGLRGKHGQAYGKGEYFATTPETSMSYCCSAKKMLVNELLLGKQGTDHTRSGDIIVMKDPAHDLPRFIITFN